MAMTTLSLPEILQKKNKPINLVKHKTEQNNRLQCTICIQFTNLDYISIRLLIAWI